MLGWKSYRESGRSFMVRDCWLVVLELEEHAEAQGESRNSVQIESMFGGKRDGKSVGRVCVRLKVVKLVLDDLLGLAGSRHLLKAD